MAKAVVEWSADDVKAFRSMVRLEAKNRELEARLKAVGRSGKKAGRDIDQSFGAAAKQFGGTALSNLKKHAAGFISIGAAVGGVAAALRFSRQESEAAISSLQRLVDVRRKLIQITEGEGGLAGKEALRDRLAVQFGVGRQRVGELLFSAGSLNAERSVPLVLALSRVLETEAGATLAGKIPGVFGGRVNARQSLNLGLAGAARSELTVGQFAKVLPQAAVGVNLAGGDPLEAFSLLSTLPERLSTGEQTAQLIKAFGTKVSTTPELRGRGVFGAANFLLGKSPAERQKIVGESQEVAVFLDRFQAARQELGARSDFLAGELALTGTPSSRVNRKIREARLNPSVQLETEVERASIRREIAREKNLAGQEGRRQIALDTVIAGLDEGGGNQFQKFLAETVGGAFRFFGADAQDVGVAAGTAATLGGGASGAFAATDATEKMQRTLERLDNTLQQATPSSGPTLVPGGEDK